MLAVLLSDIHDHISNLLIALAEAEELGCRHLLCTGDIASLSTLRTMREAWPFEMDLVFGNNEYDHACFQRLASTMPDTQLHGDEAKILLNTRRLYLTHYPHLATKAAATGQYDAVFYGHTHQAQQQLIGRTLLANPGEICGARNAPSFATYNTATNQLIHYML